MMIKWTKTPTYQAPKKEENIMIFKKTLSWVLLAAMLLSSVPAMAEETLIISPKPEPEKTVYYLNLSCTHVLQ